MTDILLPTSQKRDVEHPGAFARLSHLSDDKAVAKMGHPIVVVCLDVGHPSHSTISDVGHQSSVYFLSAFRMNKPPTPKSMAANVPMNQFPCSTAIEVNTNATIRYANAKTTTPIR